MDNGEKHNKLFNNCKTRKNLVENKPTIKKK